MSDIRTIIQIFQQLISSTISGMDRIVSKNYDVLMSVLKLAPSKILPKLDNLFVYIKNLFNTIFELNNISIIVYQADFIFRDSLLCHLGFGIKKIKSALLIL